MYKRQLVGALTAILRAVAVVDGLVCLYTLVQALALVAVEHASPATTTTDALLHTASAEHEHTPQVRRNALVSAQPHTWFRPDEGGAMAT